MATADEKRAYQRGYQAGRKRVADEDARWMQVQAEIHAKTVARRDAFFCAALTGLIVNGNWQIGKNKAASVADYVTMAKEFANASVMAVKP
jgi:hypothetical protein